MPVVVSVNPRRCGANGQCWQVAPDGFRLGPDAVAQVLASSFPDEALPRLRAAEDTCPTGAISVTAS